MMITFIVAAGIAAIILRVNGNPSALRWLGAALFAVAISVACSLFDTNYSGKWLADADRPNANLLINTLNLIADVLLGYMFGTFAAAYSDLLNRRQLKWWMLSFAGLAVVAWALTPLASIRHINYAGWNGLPISVYESMLMLSGVALLIVSQVKERHPIKKIERLLTNLLVVPPMLWMCFAFFFYSAGIDIWQYNYVAAVVFLLLFLFIGIRQGVLGVRIKLEQLQSAASQGALQDSVSFIRHSIKNEIGKVDIVLHQLDRAIRSSLIAESVEAARMEEMIGMANQSVSHLQAMMNRIQHSVQAIRLQRQRVNLLRLAEQRLDECETTHGPAVKVERRLSEVREVEGDAVLLKEVIGNLLNNAIEAMDGRGTVVASLFETKREVVLRIEDSGKGMTKDDQANLFEPFFTTKEQNEHYGVGLFYCKNVIRKHGGTIEATSAPGQGAAFTVRLPKSE